MILENTIWLVGLALEILCLRRLALGQNVTLGAFVAWQLALDIAAVFCGHLAAWNVIYWLGHSVTYVLLLFVFVPRHFRSLSGLYWLTTLILAVFATTEVWLYAHRRQYFLAVFCGSLGLFSAVVSYATRGHWLPKATWAGVMLWASGQIVAAAWPEFYGSIYPTTCTIALALFLVGTYAPVPLYTNAIRLDHYRVPLGPRFLRRRLRTA